MLVSFISSIIGVIVMSVVNIMGVAIVVCCCIAADIMMLQNNHINNLMHLPPKEPPRFAPHPAIPQHPPHNLHQIHPNKHLPQPIINILYIFLNKQSPIITILYLQHIHYHDINY